MAEEDIKDVFGVPSENVNGKRVVNFVLKRNCAWVTHISITGVYASSL